jgi:Holliday junction DNA helicase RuvA
MIASLRGTIAHIATDHLVLDVGGVGYLVYAPRTVLGSIGAVGDALHLLTVQIVREDSLSLYGFSTSDQRTLFESLLSVSGIGPKVALNMLSAGSPDELRMAIAQGDTTRLSRVPGIGKKTAERLVLELKGKIDLKGLPTASAPNVPPAVAALNNELAELLTNLGYSSAEAATAIAALPADAPETLEDRLRLALRTFGSA